MREVRQVLAQLPAGDREDLAGQWDGTFVGRRTLRWLTAAIAAASPLRGWCGKQIGPSGEVHNLVRRAGGVESSVSARAARGLSLIDGRPAVIVDYSGTAKAPVSWLHGEMRWARPGEELLGVLIFPLGKRHLGPFPFRLSRAGRAVAA